MSTATHKIGWIKRRARRLQRFYGIERSLAVHDAWTDWIAFVGLTHGMQGGAA